MRPTNHAVHEDYLLHSFKHAARSPGPAACPKNISLLARAQQVNALHASTPCPACKVAAQLPSRLPQSSHQISTLSLYLREPAGKEGSNTEGRMGVGECKSNDYGAAAYWDARYSSGSPASAAAGCGFFDWYQTYPALRPLLRARVPTSSRVLMLGCGNSLLSEDMVKDGYEDIVNIDISSVVIEQMREKHKEITQLTYMQMDIRDMGFFGDESFDCVLDKGTLDAMMCADDAPHGAFKMLAEVARLLMPHGIYLLITYGAPKERVPLLNQSGCSWSIALYIMPTAGYQLRMSKGAPHLIMEEVTLTEGGQLPPDYVLKDPDSHFIYVCEKLEEKGTNCRDADPKESTNAN